MKASSKRSLLKAAFSAMFLGFIGFAAPGYVSSPPAAATDAKEPSANKTAPVLDPRDPGSVIYLDHAGKPAGVGDPSRPPSLAYKKGRGWHPEALTASDLPKDKFGLIDWAKSVRQNRIAPKPSLDPDEAADEMPPLKMDVLIPAKSDYVNDVIYPHEMHTYWLKCEVCHPKIFIPQKGANNITMVGIANGKWCGRCHNRIAFPLADCNRCHVSPKKASESAKSAAK